MTSNGYAYKSYLDVVLAKPEKGHLAQMYIKDDEDALDEPYVYLNSSSRAGAPLNTALVSRAKFFTGSREVVLESPLNLDMCNQDRLIPHSVPIKIKLYQNPPEFYIMSPHTDKKYHIQIVDAKLKLAAYKLSPACILALEDTLKQRPARYPIQRSVVKSYTVSNGSHSHIIDNMFPEGLIPMSMLVALVSSDDFNGRFNGNPFDLDNFNLSSLGYYVNDLPFPGRPLSLRFGDSEFDSEITEAWMNLHRRNPDCEVSLKEFHSGFTIFQIDLSQQTEEGVTPLTSKGISKLELKFRTALAQSINVIVYAKFNGLITIDHTRAVTVQ